MKNLRKYPADIKANALQLKKTMVVLGSMAKKDVKNQYRRSVLGIFWTVLSPLLNMLVLAFVFSTIFGRTGVDLDYPVYVLSGNIVFGLMRTSTSTALSCIVENYDLLTKTRVNHSIFPISKNITGLVNFAFSLIALIIVMLVRIPAGVSFHWTLLMIIVPWLPAIFIFNLGMSFILATIYVRFRDIKHIYGIFLTLWMYLTPIFYSTTALPAKVRNVLMFNPMFHYLNYFRELLVGTVPSWQTHLICYGAGIFFLAIGGLIFRLAHKKFILYI